MKQLRQQPSHSNNKAWTSLDCLLTSSLPISPLSPSSRNLMHSNVNLPMTDSRRISPQTTASSGYHSDLSSATSTNQSPQSLHEIVSVPIDKSPRSSRTLSTLAMRVPKQNSSLIDNSVYDKASTQKNLSRISSFIRRQYERARSKFTSHNNNTSQQQRIPINTNTVKTCTKATSTTPLHHLTGEHSLAYSTKSPSNGCYRQTTNNYRAQYLPTSYKHSSYTEPVYSIYVHPKYNSNNHRNYVSIHECHTQKPTSHNRSSNYSSIKTAQDYSSSCRQASMSASYHEPTSVSRHDYYAMDSSNYGHFTSNRARNPSKLIDSTRVNYAPLSDFGSTKTSAFKPVHSKRSEVLSRPAPVHQLYEHLPVLDDPCDLEVAQYFPQTSQWSNPNYFDIYTNDSKTCKTHYTETLC